MYKEVILSCILLVALLLVSCGKSGVDQMGLPKAGEQIAVIHTSMGDITVKFFPESAPKAVENFVTHAKEGYYDDMIFHRVIEDFMIQSGSPLGDGIGGESIWGESFEDEFDKNLHHFNGALSMANRGANTNGSQFFIIQCRPEAMNQDSRLLMERLGVKGDLAEQYMELGGTPHLDHEFYPGGGGHTIFGQVIDGMDVVEEIGSVRVIMNQSATERSKPKDDIVILSIEITEYEK